MYNQCLSVQFSETCIDLNAQVMLLLEGGVNRRQAMQQLSPMSNQLSSTAGKSCLGQTPSNM